MARLLYVSTSTTVGGAEKTLYTLATLVDPAKHPVVGIVSVKPEGEYARRLRSAGHKVFTLGVEGTPGFRHARRLAAIARETGAEVVHAVMYQAIQLCRTARAMGWADFGLVSSPRVNYRTRSGLSLFVDTLLKANDDLLVTESDASRRYLLNPLGYEPLKVVTIRNGVDLAGWSASKTDRRRLRETIGAAPGDLVLGTVGRLDRQKGQSILLEAVAKLRVVRPEVRAVLIGDGPLRKDLEALARSLRVDQHVHFMGESAEVTAWLSAMDLFVLPSLWEGLPNALLEAMGMGLPVIASRVDGVPEVVEHDKTGLLVAPSDPQAVFVAVQDLLMDPALRVRLGQAAKALVLAKFKVADMVSAYENTYARAASAAARRRKG